MNDNTIGTLYENDSLFAVFENVFQLFHIVNKIAYWSYIGDTSENNVKSVSGLHIKKSPTEQIDESQWCGGWRISLDECFAVVVVE